MSPDEEHTEQETETPPVTHDEAPQWAKDLQRTLTELPGKLKASIADNDINRISEGVHELFERSGAFHPETTDSSKDEESTEREATTTEQQTERTTTEAAPKKGGKMSKFASWFAGEG